MSIPVPSGIGQLIAKLQLLQKQCELLEQIMSEHELNSPVHVMDNLSAQIGLELNTVNRMTGFEPPLHGFSPAMEALGLVRE